jgi:hypothetical protein
MHPQRGTDNKYVVLRVHVGGGAGVPPTEREVVILLSHLVVHRSAVPRGLRPADVVSAGFFRRLPGGAVEAYGYSASLGRDSRGEVDADLIARFLDGQA